MQILPIPCRLCRGGGAASLLRLTTSCPLSPDTKYPASAGLVAAGAGRCRIITHWKLHQDTALALWPASQLLHVTLVRCPAVVVACCRAAAKPGVHVPIRNGQQQARPVAGGRGKLYQCQGHAAGHWVDTLTCSCPSVVTGWRLGDWDTAPPTNVTTKYRCCHAASWRVTRDACPHLLRHSFSDDFISPDTTWGRHIRPWRTEQPSRIWKLNCINISAPPQENSRQARCVKDRSPNLEFSWQGFYLVYTEYRRLSLTLVDRNTSLSSVKYLLYAEVDTCIVMKSKYLDDIFT